MHNITARDPDHALGQAVKLLSEYGIKRGSRAGEVLELNGPCVTEWTTPAQRVIFNPYRNANPFFHLFESLWILAGRRDVRFLTLFNKRMADFSDDGETFHAPYGWRIKEQLPLVIEHLRDHPHSRRAVLQIWDAFEDLDVDSRDIPCNDLIFLKVRDGRLNMTVCCRSNDMLWGAYGANVVQFSMLQEYIAAALGIEVGAYYQVSDSFHVYTQGAGGALWDRVRNNATPASPYGAASHWGGAVSVPLLNGTYGETVWMFDGDLAALFSKFDSIDSGDPADQWPLANMQFKTIFFECVVKPMLMAWLGWKANMTQPALIMLRNRGLTDVNGYPIDWLRAGEEWLQRKYDKELNNIQKGENYELNV